MSQLLKQSIWFGRLVLGLEILLITRLGLDNIVHPVAVAATTRTTLGSPDAVTVIRVQGGVLVGIVVILAYCLTSERRLLAGLGFFTTIITSVAGLRLIGLALDGPGSFTLMTSKAEVAMAVVAVCAALLERRRSQRLLSIRLRDPEFFPTTTNLSRNIDSTQRNQPSFRPSFPPPTEVRND